MTIRGLLEKNAAERPERNALVWCEDKVWCRRSWREHLARVRDIAEGYGTRFNLKPRVENAAIVLGNSPVWLESYLAQSGAGVSVDNTRGDAFRKAQEKFVDLIRENCDYIDPAEKGYAYEGSLDTMFDGYAKNRFGMGFTFEISMSKIWDRAAGRRFPNSQAAFKRFARQLVTVIDKYADAIHSV